MYYPSIYLCIYLSIYLSIHVSIYIYFEPVQSFLNSYSLISFFILIDVDINDIDIELERHYCLPYWVENLGIIICSINENSSVGFIMYK